MPEGNKYFNEIFYPNETPVTPEEAYSGNSFPQLPKVVAPLPAVKNMFAPPGREREWEAKFIQEQMPVEEDDLSSVVDAEKAYDEQPKPNPEDVSVAIRRSQFLDVNKAREAAGHPPLTDVPDYALDLDGDIEFHKWVESQRPGRSTWQSAKKGAGETFIGLANIVAAPGLMGSTLGNTPENTARLEEGIYRKLAHITPFGDPRDWGVTPGAKDERTWTGAVLEVAGGLLPFVGPQSIPAILTSTLEQGRQISKNAGGTPTEQAITGVGAMAGGGALSLVGGHALGSMANKIIPQTAPKILGEVAVGGAGDAVRFLPGARSVIGEAAKQGTREAISGAGMMGVMQAGTGVAATGTGLASGNQELVQAGVEEAARTPQAAAEGSLFGGLGVIRGGMGTRAANRQALQTNRQTIAGGAEYRGNEILAQAEPAMREAQRAEQEAAAADQIIRDQETANLNAAMAKEQKLRDEAALTRQAAEQEAADIAETQRALAETPLGRGPQRRPIEENLAQRQTENVQAWRDQAAAKELAAERVPVETVDRSVFQKEFDTAEAAKQRADEAQAKAVEDVVSLARELKAVDLSTFEGQKKAAEILKRKPVAEQKPVEVPKAEPVAAAKPVVEPVAPERAPQETKTGSWLLDETGVETYHPAEGELVSARFGLSSKPAIFKGVREEAVTRGDPLNPIETKEQVADVIVEGTNHTVGVPLKDIKPLAESESVKAQRTPVQKLAVGDRVSLQTDPTKAGEVVRTSPDDLHVEIRFDGETGTKVKATSLLQREAAPADTFSAGTVVVDKNNPLKQLRVESQKGSVVFARDENMKVQRLNADDVAKTKGPDIDEAQMSADIQSQGASYELVDGKARKIGSNAPGIPIQAVDRMYVNKAAIKEEYEHLKSDTAARNTWETANGKRLPPTLAAFEKHLGTPEASYHGASRSVQVATVTPRNIIHEVLHDATLHLDDAKKNTLMRWREQSTGIKGEAYTDRAMQEFLVEQTMQAMDHAAGVKGVESPTHPKIPFIKKIIQDITTAFKRLGQKLGMKVETGDDVRALADEVNNIYAELRKGETGTSAPAKPVGEFFSAKKEEPKNKLHEIATTGERGPRETGRVATTEGGRVLEDLVSAAARESGLTGERSWAEVDTAIKDYGYDRMNVDELAKKIGEQGSPSVELATAMVARTRDLADKAAETGNKKALKDFTYIALMKEVVGSDFGRKLAVFSRFAKDRTSRRDAAFSRATMGTPAERAAMTRAIRKGDTAEIDRLAGIVAERGHGILGELKKQGIDFADLAKMKALENPREFFHVVSKIEALAHNTPTFRNEMSEAKTAGRKAAVVLKQALAIESEFWRNNILFGVGTMTRNVVGNSLSIAANAGSRTMEMFAGSVTRSKEARLSDLPGYFKAMFSDLGMAFQNGYESAKYGADALEKQSLGSNVDSFGESTGPALRVGKKTGSVAETVARGVVNPAAAALRTPRTVSLYTDGVQKTFVARAEVYMFARAKARKAGGSEAAQQALFEREIGNGTSESWLKAVDRAKRVLGGDTSGVSLSEAGLKEHDSTDMLKETLKWIHSSTLAQVTKPVHEKIAPFVNVGASFIRQGMTYVPPLQVMNMLGKHALKNFAEPVAGVEYKYAKSRQLEDVGRLLMGTAGWATAIGLAGTLAPDGSPVLVGYLPDQADKGTRELRERLGKHEHSIWTPFGRLSYKGVSPVQEMFDLAFTVRKSMDKPSKTVDYVLSDTANAAFNMLDTAEKILGFDRNRNPSQTGQDILTRISTGYTGPRVIRDIKDTMSPGTPNTHMDSFLETAAAQSRIGDVPRKVSYWGTDVDRFESTDHGWWYPMLRMSGMAPLNPGPASDTGFADLFFQAAGYHPISLAQKSAENAKPESQYAFTSQEYEEALREVGQARAQAVMNAKDIFMRVDPLDVRKSEELTRRVGGVSSLMDAAIIAKKAGNPKAETWLRTLAETGHTHILGKDSGRYTLVRKQITSDKALMKKIEIKEEKETGKPLTRDEPLDY
jgi:hypothetical protein